MYRDIFVVVIVNLCFHSSLFFHCQFSTWYLNIIILERKRIYIACYSCSFKSFEILNVWFFNVVLITIMASTFNVLIIENLNGNSFHSWKMKIKFFLHENDLWEITSRELLPSKIELGKFVIKWNNHEHHMFMKKDKLAHKTIFLNVVNFFLHLQYMQKLRKKFERTYVQLL